MKNETNVNPIYRDYFIKALGDNEPYSFKVIGNRLQLLGTDNVQPLTVAVNRAGSGWEVLGDGNAKFSREGVEHFLSFIEENVLLSTDLTESGPVISEIMTRMLTDIRNRFGASFKS